MAVAVLLVNNGYVNDQINVYTVVVIECGVKCVLGILGESTEYGTSVAWPVYMLQVTLHTGAPVLESSFSSTTLLYHLKRVTQFFICEMEITMVSTL
jgi:hypothetical protein